MVAEQESFACRCSHAQTYALNNFSTGLPRWIVCPGVEPRADYRYLALARLPFGDLPSCRCVRLWYDLLLHGHVVEFIWEIAFTSVLNDLHRSAIILQDPVVELKDCLVVGNGGAGSWKN